MTKFCLIVAVADNGVIGHDGTLPWHFPEDLQNFKDLTIGHPMIMGRNTYLDIGGPLPGRVSIVVTSSPIEPTHPDLIVVSSIAEAMVVAGNLDKERAFFIGGARIFKESLQWCSDFYVTRVRLKPQGEVRLGLRFDRQHYQRASQTRVVRSVSPINPGLVGHFEHWRRK